MPFNIVRSDITKMETDAIVNAANSSLLGGGGVDGAIHRAAGPGLLEECRKLGGCSTGDAKLTGGHGLKCRYVIHTVGPVWHGGSSGEKELLRSCYRKSLELAAANKCESVAFPLISAGAYGYPKREALDIAASVIGEFLETHEMNVTLVIFDKASFKISSELYEDIRQYIDDSYAARYDDTERRRQSMMNAHSAPLAKLHNKKLRPDSMLSGLLKRKSDKNEQSAMEIHSAVPAPLHEDELCADVDTELGKILRQQDESFSESLLRLIDQKGYTDVQVYKKANIDRKLFSKIRSNPSYKPKKQTAVAFAIALELSIPETEALLKKAGYALSGSLTFDLIVRYFIEHGNFNIFEINEALFAFDQVLIGN